MATPLSSTEVAAWADILSQKRGSRKLQDHVQAGLLNFFKVNGVHLVDQFPVDEKDPDVKKVWQEFCEDASLKQNHEIGAVMRWLDGASSAAAAPAQHRTQAIVTIVQESGITLPSGVIAMIDQAMVGAGAGDKKAQAASFEFVCTRV